jgi:acetoin utilization deacetylase AcuC-like enzyme
MIIYNKEIDLNLKGFGIEVPLLDDRSSKTFSKLGNIEEVDLATIPLLTKEDVSLAHTSEFVDKLFSSQIEAEITKCYELVNSDGNYRRYDPSSAKYPLKELFNKILLQASCTSFAALNVKSFCFSLAGGMHHAMTDTGRGFCLINDLVIAARVFQRENPGSKVAIVDIDAHKGCGSAQITCDDDSIETLSIHMKDGWPLDPESGEGPWHTPSTIDIPVSVREQDKYLTLLEEGLNKFNKCDLVLVAAGADPYSEDILESARGLSLSKEVMLKRDLLVYKFFKNKNIPQVWTLAGGYGPRTWEIYYQFLKSIREEESF